MVSGSIVLTIKAIAKTIQFVAQFLIDFVDQGRQIRFSWIIIMELLGLCIIYWPSLLQLSCQVNISAAFSFLCSAFSDVATR